MKHTFIVIADAPQGISMSEVADHLADASRRMTASYHSDDPMAHLREIVVLGTVPRASLPPATCVHGDPQEPVSIHDGV